MGGRWTKGRRVDRPSSGGASRPRSRRGSHQWGQDPHGGAADGRCGGDLPSAGTTVLRLPSAADFQPSVKWLEGSLTEDAAIDQEVRAIGSPDMARLTMEIERIGATIGQGRLKGVVLVIIADATQPAASARRLLDPAPS